QTWIAEQEIEERRAKSQKPEASKGLLIFQRDHILVALAEGGDALQPAFRLRQQPDRAHAVYGVAVFCEVPAASLARGSLGGDVIGRRRRGRNPERPLER